MTSPRFSFVACKFDEGDCCAVALPKPTDFLDNGVKSVHLMSPDRIFVCERPILDIWFSEKMKSPFQIPRKSF